MAPNEEKCEQTDDPTHESLSVNGDCSYSAWGEKEREEGDCTLVCPLGHERKTRADGGSGNFYE